MSSGMSFQKFAQVALRICSPSLSMQHLQCRRAPAKLKSNATMGKSSDPHASQLTQSSDPSSGKASAINPDSAASCATRLSSMSLDSITEDKLHAQRDLLKQSAAKALSGGNTCPGLDRRSQARLFNLFLVDVVDLHCGTSENFSSSEASLRSRDFRQACWCDPASCLGMANLLCL